jgi:activating signal cointegrator 1
MKAITIRQPWASLIKENIKKVEIRSWKTKYRGEIFIHAGSGVDKEYLEKYKNIIDINNLPTKKIIAKCNIVDCILLTSDNIKLLNQHNIGYQINEKSIGQYGFILEDINLINCNKEIKGQLGLWNIESLDN